MLSWLKDWAGHCFLGLIALDHLWDRVEPVILKFRKAEIFVERRIHERRHNMINLTLLAEVPQALNLIVTAIPKVQAAIPLVQKTVADINQAVADGKNPAALTADLTNLLADLNNDLIAISSLFPAPAPTTPAA